MFCSRKFHIAKTVVLCLIIVIMEGSNVFGQNRQSSKKYTDTEFRAKYNRLTTSRERVAKLIERGYPPKILEEARDTVKIAEEEFGETNSIVIRPLLTLGELLGTYRYYDEATQAFEKIYSIIESGENESLIYAIGYRIRIADFYLAWNKFKEAELALLKAKEIIESFGSPSRAKYRFLNREETTSLLSDEFYDSYTQQINAALERVYNLMEINNLKKIKK